MKIEEIFDKLIGHIDSYGETNHDNESMANLDTCYDLLTHITQELADNVKTISNHQYSMQAVAKRSYEILSDIYDIAKTGCTDYKERLYKDDYKYPKFRKIDSLPHIYIVTDTDTIISPFSKEYTLEWYQKHYDDSVTIDNIEELTLFEPDLSNGGYLVPKYQPDDKALHYWTPANSDEIKFLGTNMLIQPNVSKLGSIMNHYGDIYVLKSYYDALEMYKDIEEPEVLCSHDF